MRSSLLLNAAREATTLTNHYLSGVIGGTVRRSGASGLNWTFQYRGCGGWLILTKSWYNSLGLVGTGRRGFGRGPRGVNKCLINCPVIYCCEKVGVTLVKASEIVYIPINGLFRCSWNKQQSYLQPHLPGHEFLGVQVMLMQSWFLILLSCVAVVGVYLQRTLTRHDLGTKGINQDMWLPYLPLDRYQIPIV